MVRPPDEPRRQVEGNPIRLDPRLRIMGADPYRGAAVFRLPERVVGRSRSRLSRIRTERIDEVNRDNAITRRIFQNMHIRNRSNNIEHNSMNLRNGLVPPSHPYNVRRTRNKPRRLGVTNAQHQRSRPDARDIVLRQREELGRLLESLKESPEDSSSHGKRQSHQNASSFNISENPNEDPQQGTSGVSQKISEEPQPGTSTSDGYGGCSGLNFVCRQSGYWRPDLDMSSSEEDIAGNDTYVFTQRNPKGLNSDRKIVQEVMPKMRTKAEMLRKKARKARARILLENISESDSDEDVSTSSKKICVMASGNHVKVYRNSRRNQSNRDIVQEVRTEIRTQAETRRKEARTNRNKSQQENSFKKESVPETNNVYSLEKNEKDDALKKSRRNTKSQHSKRDIVQEVRNDLRKNAEMRRKETKALRNRNIHGVDSESDLSSNIPLKRPFCQEVGVSLTKLYSDNDIQTEIGANNGTNFYAQPDNGVESTDAIVSVQDSAEDINKRNEDDNNNKVGNRNIINHTRCEFQESNVNDNHKTMESNESYSLKNKDALLENRSQNGNMHNNGSHATSSSSLFAKMFKSEIIDENSIGSSHSYVVNLPSVYASTSSDNRKVTSKETGRELIRQPASDEEKERESALKRMRNMLFELLFENHMSSPKGASPVEQWWNEGKVIVFSNVAKKSKTKGGHTDMPDNLNRQ